MSRHAVRKTNYSRGVWRLVDAETLDEIGHTDHWGKWRESVEPVCGETKAECVELVLKLLWNAGKRIAAMDNGFTRAAQPRGGVMDDRERLVAAVDDAYRQLAEADRKRCDADGQRDDAHRQWAEAGRKMCEAQSQRDDAHRQWAGADRKMCEAQSQRDDAYRQWCEWRKTLSVFDERRSREEG